jgi:hypothetical protein
LAQLRTQKGGDECQREEEHEPGSEDERRHEQREARPGGMADLSLSVAVGPQILGPVAVEIALIHYLFHLETPGRNSGPSIMSHS